MSAIMYTAIGLAAVNVVLALVLGSVYYRNHKEIKSPFTMGLMLFALFLVIHNATLVYHFLTMMPSFGPANEVMFFLEQVLQTGATATLVTATMR